VDAGIAINHTYLAVVAQDEHGWVIKAWTK
jgi:hypothetical protein